MPKFTVVYDACVLYPAPLRDFLMQLAISDLFRACWTEQIHDEWIGNLCVNRPDLKEEHLQRTRTLMDKHALDALVTGYQDLIESLFLPDPKDRHVLAAAIRAGASAIVTYNLSDFPASELEKYNIEAIHPDDFIFHQIHLSELTVLQAARTHRARLKNPRSTITPPVQRLFMMAKLPMRRRYRQKPSRRCRGTGWRLRFERWCRCRA